MSFPPENLFLKWYFCLSSVMVRPSGHGSKVCLLIGFLLRTKSPRILIASFIKGLRASFQMISLFFHSVLHSHSNVQDTVFFFPSKNLPQTAESISFSPKLPQLMVHFPFCQGQSVPMERLVFVTCDWGTWVRAGDPGPRVIAQGVVDLLVRSSGSLKNLAG